MQIRSEPTSRASGRTDDVRTRRNRDHPLTRRYLAVISQRAQRLVNLPDDAEGVRYAGMEGLPVQDVSPAMRAAYRELTHAIATAPLRQKT